MRQEIAFATSGDGTRIAWARHGHGPPLVRAATWLTNIEQDWSSPVWRHWLSDLGSRFTVIRYDDRGSGLSDREVDDLSLDAWVSDLEAVVDAAGLATFDLLGVSQAGAVAVAYADRHPDRVSHLVLYGAFARGALARDPSPQMREENELHLGLIRLGWGRADPSFRRVFTSSFIPGGAETQLRWFDELQRHSMAPEAALRASIARSTIDVSQAAARLRVPTLVLHVDDDHAVPFEEGRRLAGLIPGGRFVPIPGRNHIILADEPAWPIFLEEVASFLGSPGSGGGPSGVPGSDARGRLSERELQVVGLVAEGRSNEDIAQRLGVSVRTVERHLSNVYLKLSLSGKSARAGAAAIVASSGRHG